MTSKETTNIAVEIIAKSIVTDGLILVLTSRGLEEKGEQLISGLKRRGTKLRPLSLKDYKRLDDAGLNEFYDRLYRSASTININQVTYVEDEYSFANEVFNYSRTNENNVLVLIRDDNDDEALNNAVKVANALKLSVLLLGEDDDVEDIAYQVDNYLYR